MRPIDLPIRLCSMKITQAARDYAARQSLDIEIQADAALINGMEVKAVEFAKKGAEICLRA